MSQQMNVIHCSSCKAYQVHIVKKAKKWRCKICNFQQSFKEVYFQGSGKDCRLFVQKLNLMKENEAQENVSFGTCDNMNNDCTNTFPEELKSNVSKNKWAKYLDTSEEIESNTFDTSNDQAASFEKPHDTMYLDDDNSTCEYSQSEHINVNNDSLYENDLDRKFDSDDEEEYNDVVSEANDNTLHSGNTSKNNDFHSKNVIESKCSTSIFDDNEDFDTNFDF
ncbi:unnamed protein product [Xylocopa violacea]|uniref:MRN complex-interacting protein N-terminal domain-containing protein n=1 Tax=Xylocopa violacea TaxID=135666 RepID=A0ABP1NQB2_XYLVO